MSKKQEPTTSGRSMSFVEASPAKTCPQPATLPGLTETDPVYGLNSSELQTRSVQPGLLLKTYITPGEDGCPSCGKTLMASVMDRCHYDCQPLTWAHGIEGEEFSYWPTLTASSYGSCRGGGAGRIGKIRKSMSGLIGGLHHPGHAEQMMGFPVGWTDLDALETP